MIYGLDGRKMSTSWGNVINILEEPKEMFGKLMSLRDELIIGYFESCTRVPMLQINEFKNSLENKTVNPKEIKKILAKEIISIFYDRKKAEEAEKEFEQVFEEKKLPSEIEEIKVEEERMNAQEFLVKLKLASSKGEAKRLIEQGGVRLIKGDNIQEISDWQLEIQIQKGVIVQVGKRNFRKIV
jgi:tyrosyl-tRNA synthetase